MNFLNELNDRQVYIEKVIDNFLPKEEGYQKNIISAMKYSISAGGKRIRPILMNETYKLFGGNNDIIEPFIAAIEMIHTYSLVHDDLPAMDNDDYRRGRLTTHKVFGEAIGILTGDALLNYAFEIATRAFDSYIEQSLRIGKALQLLGNRSGIYGMIGGQVVDIESENNDVDVYTLDFIHVHKTSALIEASMGIGAILAGASERDIELIINVARKVGLAFQIQDDILDVTSSMEVLGKPVHSDEKNNKITYVKLVGIDKATEKVEQLSSEAINELNTLEYKNDFLTELIKSLINRSK